MAEPNAVPTAVSDLEIGMYVTALDRPWIETPFLMQGFYITSQQDVEELERFCKYVYVDVYRSKTGPVRRTARVIAEPGERPAAALRAEEPLSGAQFQVRATGAYAALFPHRKLKPYEDASDMLQELPRAKGAYGDLARAVDEMMEGYRRGGSLDASGIRAAVDPMVESAIRNPDACVWLSRLRGADTYTHQHSVGAAVWAVALGRQLGLPKIDLQRLALGALVFDVGKLRMPPELLNKRERLTRGEFQLLKSHVQFSMEMLQNTGVLNRSIAQMVESHHERHGGHGYPQGLQGEEIPVFARIAAIVDCFDAITSRRPYSTPLSPSSAVKKLYAWRDVDFQALLVEAFIQAIGIYPAGTLVELSSGDVGVVLGEYRVRKLRPLLLIVRDRDKQPLPAHRLLDLRSAARDAGGTPLEIETSLEPGAFGIVVEDLQI